MSRREKLRRKLRNRPADCTMQDVQTVLQLFGFVLARIQGSHHIFEYDDSEQFAQIVVPLHGRKVKRVYIQTVIKWLDRLFPPEADSSEEENGQDA